MSLGAAAVLHAGAARLRAAGIEEARREARLLLAHCMGIGAETLFAHPQTEVGEAAAAAFEAGVRRREAREPLSHILGRREFWGLSFAVGGDVLDPRPDTETVVALALALGRPERILDLGTGSGAILCALLHELPEAIGIGADRSEAALAIARGNAAALGLGDRAGFVLSDWGAAADGRFDLVVSNPPYIRSLDIGGLAPEVARFEPRVALDGGADGLDAYRAIADGIEALLEPQGLAVLEIGAGQAEEVVRLFAAAGFSLLESRADLGGITRALAFCRDDAKIKLGQSASPR